MPQLVTTEFEANLAWPRKRRFEGLPNIYTLSKGGGPRVGTMKSWLDSIGYRLGDYPLSMASLEECRRLGHQLREQGISAWDIGSTVLYGRQTFCEECQNLILSPPINEEERRAANERIKLDAEEEEIFLNEQPS